MRRGTPGRSRTLRAVRAKSELKIPDDFEVHALIAIGWRGKPEALPEKLREIVFDSRFGQTFNELPTK